MSQMSEMYPPRDDTPTLPAQLPRWSYDELSAAAAAEAAAAEVAPLPYAHAPSLPPQRAQPPSFPLRAPAQPQSAPLPPYVTPALPVAHPAPRVSERLLAAAAHLMVMLTFPGSLLASAIWALNRRSPFVAFHARQAVLWQALTHVVFVLLLGIGFLLVFFSLGGALNGITDGTNKSGGIGLLISSFFGIFVLIIAAALFFTVSAIIGALFALFGKTYHYPIINRGSERSKRAA